MGYYTRFNISIENIDEVTLNENVIENIVDELDIWGMNEYGVSEEPSKWYSHEDDMRSVSKNYPNLVFKLVGAGEENSDIWVKYFKNGMMQECRAKIAFDDYDESKLK